RLLSASIPSTFLSVRSSVMLKDRFNPVLIFHLLSFHLEFSCVSIKLARFFKFKFVPPAPEFNVPSGKYGLSYGRALKIIWKGFNGLFPQESPIALLVVE